MTTTARRLVPASLTAVLLAMAVAGPASAATGHPSPGVTPPPPRPPRMAPAGPVAVLRAPGGARSDSAAAVPVTV